MSATKAMKRTVMMGLARVGMTVAAMVVVQASAVAGTITYYHNDLAGSPVAATNSAGQVLWRESFRPYGERTTNSAASTGNDVWFTSRRQDTESDLVYMGARYYDPMAGRFASTDPKGFDESTLHSFNRYAYANNNPYRYVDPDGKAAQLLARATFSLSYEAATALGAATVGGWIGVNLYNLMHQEAAEGSGNAAPSPEGAKETSDQGCVYCVKGDKTKSGKDYVGSTDNLDQRQRDKTDGRDREGAEVIDSYPKGDRGSRRAKEQQAINDRGGVDNLDNRRNEIAPGKWSDFDVKPPN